MGKSVLKLCGKCWRVLQYNEDNIVCHLCHDCLHNAFIGGGNTVSANESRVNMRYMLWSLFPQCEILEDTTIDGIHSPHDEYPIFSFVIPEYRMAIDIVDECQLLPLGDNTIDEDRAARLDFDDIKSNGTSTNNYRWVIAPRDVNEARNIIIRHINQVKILNAGNGTTLLTPKYPGDAGYDIVTATSIVCPPQQGTDIPSNLFLEIPNHLYGIIQARSSTSKRRVAILPGIIDPGYRGRIYVMVFNLTDTPVEIKAGERVAQMLFYYRAPHLNLLPVEALSPSDRSDKGFGSSGA